ncbi:MAG: PEP-CTERM sorting domain-containing protein [Planctomycetota bacterium]
MKSSFTSQAVVPALAALLLGVPAWADTLTVATFADPSPSSMDPLFTVDLGADRITSTWGPGKTGLDLEVILTGITYPDAYFTLSQDAAGLIPGIRYVDNPPGSFYGPTRKGFIRFFAADDTPLMRIKFNAAFLTPGGVGADEIVSLNIVDIRGPALPGGGAGLTDEGFGFAFANQVRLPGPDPTDPGDDLLKATASFTSSAVPEPSMVTLFGFGLLTVARRRRRT